MVSDDIDPNEGFILFSDKRQLEHRRRQSVITVDDTDVILHQRATRRSILYGGDSQGPRFWNHLKSVVWSNQQRQSPVPSPTSVRDIQDLEEHQEAAIFNSKPSLMPFADGDDQVDRSDVIKVSARTCQKDDASHSNSTARASMTSTISSSPGGGTDTSSASSSRPFRSVWDRLDAWSVEEHQRVARYHATVQQQNERIAAAAAVADATSYDNEEAVEPGVPARNQFGPRGSGSATTTTVAPFHLGGRLRRQNSWNGRESNRDLIQARGSVRAIADDCSLRELFQNSDGQLDDDAVEDQRTQLPVTARLGKPTATTTKKRDLARTRADQCVINLVM